ncbi:site-specific tyrosine recombinase XerC [Yersinia aleksiciae]|uniref:site-specific tyrosine recombinase XerC n=1 Tax=Yersinia aleksiciae TaxID=263819 RepID=UPI0025AA4BFE|nr:site-specific tyrosine recombinase XerC [Yersinia aleksiciae]MDN0122578.1 site-specific tyrosine recombinase XerC [Yersinia aleksiciae]
MANRQPRANRLLSMDDIYRKPVGPATDPKSLYALLLRFINWRRERNWSETTLKTQSHHSYRFICWANERGISYAAEVTKPLLERYQRTTLQPLQVWFRWMAKQNLLLANPAADLELPKLEKRLPRTILSIDEIEQVLSLPDVSTLQGIRDRALLELLWSTGIRRSEAAALEQYSVDTSRRIITIVQGKGKTDRVIPIGARALGWILRYLQDVRPELVVKPDIKALFVALDGVAGLTPNGITNTVGGYIKASGIAKWGSCHLFRHAMATQMLENGADIRWIQAMLGHASIESTQIYTQVSIRALQAVHASTHPAEQSASETPPDSPQS